MKDFAYFSNTFNIQKTTTYQLNLSLRPLNITYVILDTVRNKCVGVKNAQLNQVDSVKDYYNQIQSFIDSDNFLSKNFKHINFVFSSPKSTLIPEEYFNKKALKDYFTINHQLDEYEEIHFNRMQELEMVNVFSIPSEITTLMVNYFPELRFYHQATTLIQGLDKTKSKKKYVVKILMADKYFDIVIAEVGKLKLHNNIPYANEDDFVYHIMNIYKQLNISNANSDLFFCGNITQESSTYKLLKNYLSNVWFDKILEDKKINYNFAKVPEHIVSNLLNI